MYTLNTRLFFTNKAQHFFSFQSTIMEVNSGRGKEGRARHKISWMEMVQTDLKSLNVEVNLIYDQEEWRRRIHIGNPTSLGLRILLLLLLLLFVCLLAWLFVVVIYNIMGVWHCSGSGKYTWTQSCATSKKILKCIIQLKSIHRST